MSARRVSELAQVFNVVVDLKEAPIGFSRLSHRDLQRKLQPANEVLELFLDKVIGDDVEDKARYLLLLIKKLFPRGKWKNFIVNEFDNLEDYSALDRNKKKTYGRQKYKVFDEVLKKVSGSEDPETHRQFMSARFLCIHQEHQNFRPLVAKPS